MDNHCPDRREITCTSGTHIHFRYVLRSCVDANDRAICEPDDQLQQALGIT
jgi:hypothetical protein